jgi:hypothetical protein
LRPLLGKREEKRGLATSDPAEAKRVHTQALAELEHRWANLRAGPKTLSEREAHELVPPAYEWWANTHRDNPRPSLNLVALVRICWSICILVRP